MFVEADLDGLIEGSARSTPRSAARHVPQVRVRADWQSVDESVERIVGALVRAGVLESADTAGGR
ncbi:MAG: hypothetical protein LC791_15145 [Acidobacteria bacterium]|nr:hypothetical protein [Acidobacteriota bacterium]